MRDSGCWIGRERKRGRKRIRDEDEDEDEEGEAMGERMRIFFVFFGCIIGEGGGFVVNKWVKWLMLWMDY